MKRTPDSEDAFTIERHGEVTVIVASPSLEFMDATLVEPASELMLSPLRGREEPLVIVDLTHLDFFGSAFLQLLLKCWNFARRKGGQMVLAGVSTRARELLHITSLDIIWPIYGTRQEAIEALLAD
jgi:anti-anti-sigma factor